MEIKTLGTDIAKRVFQLHGVDAKGKPILKKRLSGWKVSIVAMNGMTFELDTPHGCMMATMLAEIA